MKRFLSLALLALFCLFSNVARADDGPTFTPADGSTVESFSTVTIVWDDICDNGDVTDNKLVVYDASGTKVTQATNNSCAESGKGAYYESTTLTYSLAKEVTDPGTYTIEIPEAYFLVNYSATELYKESPAYTLTVTIPGAEEEADITLVSPEPDEDGTLTLEGFVGEADDEDNATELVFKVADDIGANSTQYTLYWAVSIVDGPSDSDYPYDSYANYDSSTGTFTMTPWFSLTFYEGTTYELTAWVKMGGTTVVEEMTVATIIGATSTGEDPRSTVSLISSDPDYYDVSHYEIELEKVQALPVTLTFDGYVAITAVIDQSHQGEVYTGNSIDLNATGVDGTADSTGDYYTQWTFTIPASEIGDDDYGGEISVTIAGTDSIGKVLFDSSGYTMLTYSYTIDEVDADLSDYTFTPADGATVSELDSIVIANTNGIAVSWYVDSFDITDEDGNVVETISAEDDIVENYESDEEPDENSGQKGGDDDDSWGNAYSVTITLPEAITDEGTYTVTIPYKFFVIGIGDVTTNSPTMTLTYTVGTVEDNSGEGEGEESGEGEGDGTETGISAIKAAIANGAEVYTISGQKVSAPVSGVNVVKYADGTVKKILQK